MDEIWKPIPGFDGYEVSNMGNVRSYYKRGARINPNTGKLEGVRWKIDKKPQRILSVSARNGNAYKMVVLMRDGKGIGKRISYLVMLAFVGKRPEGMEVCHNNSDPSDDRLENLRYDTPLGNARDRCHLTDEQIIEMKSRRANGERIKPLSKYYNLSQTQVKSICAGQSFSQVGGINTTGLIASDKLTYNQVREIRSRRETGETLLSIANDYNISESAVSLIVRRLRWAHIE